MCLELEESLGEAGLGEALEKAAAGLAEVEGAGGVADFLAAAADKAAQEHRSLQDPADWIVSFDNFPGSWEGERSELAVSKEEHATRVVPYLECL